VHNFASSHSEVFIRWYQKWDSNWLWAPGNDHKMCIFGPVDTQLLYFNIRGNSGGTTGYAAIHVITPDSVIKGDNVTVTRGAWHRFEINVRWGSGGYVRARIDGTDLTWAHEAGNVIDPENVNPGANCGFIKMDNTYNNFAYFEANVVGNASNSYWDDVAVASDDWIGA
jgi:hypothetical protein